ncbi:hypothetical protein ACAF76_009395 [Brevibacillus sp. TJ4]|uniref:hypothetical protein n=1 Tax=Brevibacillus sp. TJ4 TaxID=3234853 RepID=UPI0037D62742
MPLLIAPVFNSTTPKPVRIELPDSYYLISHADKPYELTKKYLRNEMDENKRFFERRVDRTSLFLVADYPDMKVTSDREWIEEIENKLNISVMQGVCSIPYIVTIQSNMFGITYLKRSLDGSRYVFDDQASEVFHSILNQQLPAIAFSRYSLSLEKKSNDDQLVDLWIALESLFVPDGRKGEITYKLRMRMAYYFGETYDERVKIADFIKKSYNHRSEIVHSGKMFGKKLSSEVKILRHMTRAAILNMTNEGLRLQEISARLDKLIMSGESYVERYAPRFFIQVKW